MPKRPLSAYNIFFRSERQALLGEEVTKAHDLKRQAKRKHRKTHGKIGFAEMARRISSKWKSMDSEQKETFERQAANEKKKYLKALEEWKKEQAEREAEEEEIVRKVSAETKEEEEDKLIALKPAPMQVAQPSMLDDTVGLTANLSGQFTADLAALPGIILPRGSLPSYFGATPTFVSSLPARSSLPASFGSLPMPSIPALGSGGYIYSMAGDLDRRRRLEQLYQLHLQEAASLRDEMQREGQRKPSDQILAASAAHSGSQLPYADLYQGSRLGQPTELLALDRLREIQRSELLTPGQRPNLLPPPAHDFLIAPNRQAEAQSAELMALEQALEAERSLQLERQLELARRRRSDGRGA